jgi:ribonucleoside-diphosphate reductase alpha chain
MTTKNLSDFTFVSKYSRYIPEDNRRETWQESVMRSRQMMLKKYAKHPNVVPFIVRAYDDVLNKKCLGSMRSLQFAGKPIEKHNARMFNCVASHCDRLDFFKECFYLLLCGCGTGYSVQEQHVAKLPTMKPHGVKSKYVVEDSIEGWSDAADELIRSYFGQGKHPVFDFSNIRPKGAPLSAGGKAPGPEPLKNALEKVENVLENAVEYGTLRPIDCYDIVCFLADAVISGGVRRSATICVFSKDDEDMLKAKTGNWFTENPQRGRSNNSVALLRSETTESEFKEIMKSVQEFGEPGFVWVDNLDVIVNPCVEIGMYPKCPVTKETGWQGCNLSTINGAKIKDEFDFYSACFSAAVIGTLQAGFTEFPYLGPTSESIFAYESLLGVSITGIMDSADILLNPEVQRAGAEVVKYANKLVADMVGIRAAARTTCVKPEGTASCVLGTASGIHPHHYKRYIRRVQANTLDAVYRHYKLYNDESCEKSVWSANDTDDVVSFAIEAKAGAITKRKVNAIELLDNVVSTQQNWVIPGTNENLCQIKEISHNVSNTINVEPDEWDAVSDFIYENRKDLCGVSLLSATGDKDYAQAPFAAVYLPSQMMKHYGNDPVLHGWELMAGVNNDGELWQLCHEVLFEFNKNREFDAKVQQFADKHNLSHKEVTYLLKDLWTYDRYCAIKEKAVSVDYTKLVELQDNTTQQQEIACAGGACEI